VIAPIGIIGAGHIGQAFARLARRAGREVVIANSRGPQSVAHEVQALGDGVSAGTIDEVAASPIVFIGVPWRNVPAAVAAQSWGGKLVIDATNPLDLDPAELGDRTSSEIVAELVDGARVVTAANTLGSALLGADPNDGAGRRVLVLSGDDGGAKAEAAAVFEAAGFVPIDLGDLASGGRMQAPGAAFSGLNLVRLP
jgi:predicted dinucleotide-binding enzyme